MDINGVAAVVTGGASGLGAATANALAAAGARVTVLDKTNNIAVTTSIRGDNFIPCSLR